MIGKTRRLAAVNIPFYVARLTELCGAGYGLQCDRGGKSSQKSPCPDLNIVDSE